MISAFTQKNIMNVINYTIIKD